MDNMKFKPESSQESEKIQHLLFRLGFKWVNDPVTRIRHVEMPFLFADNSDMTITYSNSPDTFYNIMYDYVLFDLEMLQRLVDNPEPELVDMKFITENPDHSERIQKKLFRLGYKWVSGDTEPFCTGMRYLITHAKDKSISHCSYNASYFQRVDATLCTEKTLDTLLEKMMSVAYDDNEVDEVVNRGKHVPYPGQSAESFFAEVASQGVAQKVEFNGVGLWVDPYTADRYGVKAEVDRLMVLYTTQTYAG